MQAVYTLKQTASILQLSEATIRRRIKDGSIPRVEWCQGKILVPAYFFNNLLLLKNEVK